MVWHIALQLGALYGIVALAAIVSFRFLSFPDLTVDGSFVLGAAITARLIADGVSWPQAMLCGTVAAAGAGAVTATLHFCFGINKFFAGILMTMLLFSLNLYILDGANLSIFRHRTIFTSVENSDPKLTAFALTLAIACAVLIAIFFHTAVGLRLRGLGVNPDALGTSFAAQWGLLVLGLALSNSLAGFAGSLVTQFQHFCDVNMGVGITIAGLAGVFIGESLILLVALLHRLVSERSGNSASSAAPIFGEILAAGMGAIVLYLVTTWVLGFSIDPSRVKSVAAAFLIAAMAFRRRTSGYWLVPSTRFE